MPKKFTKAEPRVAPRRFVVTKVEIRRTSSINEYLRTGRSPADMREVLSGVAKMGNWGLTVSGDRITEAHPMVDGHPGHVDGVNWKLYVERGTGTVDRLFLTNRQYVTVQNKSKPDQMNVEIRCVASVAADTH